MSVSSSTTQLTLPSINGTHSLESVAASYVVCHSLSSPVLPHYQGCRCAILGQSQGLRLDPSQAKAHPQHEPRAGLLMCCSHRVLFNGHEFFIRFLPDIRKFVLVNYTNEPTLQQFHGKAIALDIRDRHAPFASLFILHEMRVRGFHPTKPIEPAMPDDILGKIGSCRTACLITRQAFSNVIDHRQRKQHLLCAITAPVSAYDNDHR
ncbi:hypothetical protein BJV77DRAFT_621645 [Russula vinacea]|nr:hypothetical protein BJV77DRAFT_621645 [Russula vinacea]